MNDHAFLQAQFGLIQFETIIGKVANARDPGSARGRNHGGANQLGHADTIALLTRRLNLRRAILELHDSVARKTAEVGELEADPHGSNLFNHVQANLIRPAPQQPLQDHSTANRQRNDNVVCQTARADLPALQNRGSLNQTKQGRKMVPGSPPALPDRLRKLDREARNEG